MHSRPKLLIIGLDGATFDIIEPMVKRGELTNIAALLRSGASGRLESTYPPLTPPAWTTFSTGKNPGKHGVFDFLAKAYNTGSTPNFTNFNSIKCATFWEILQDTGLRFGIVNLPMTYPPSKLNGFLISGMDTPNDQVTFSHPADLVEELRHHGIPYQVRFFQNGHRRPRDPHQLLDRFLAVEEKHKDAFVHLLRKKPCDVFVGVFMLLDKVQHFFWHSDWRPEHACAQQSGSETEPGYAVHESYKLIDRFVGEIISLADEKTYIMLVSDHGFGKVELVFFINEWLRREGLLALKKRNLISLLRQVRFRPIEKTGAQLLERFGLQGLGFILPSAILQNRFRLYWPQLRNSASAIDWTQTKAYAASYGIYINLKGRTSHGIVESGLEYERIREFIQERLLNLVDQETGLGLPLKTLKKEEVYSGPHLDVAPDLVFDAKNNNFLPNHAFNFSKLLVRRKNFATHQHEGIFLLKGPGVKKHCRIEESEIADAAPTILYLLGEPVPTDLDGKVLEDAFTTNHLKEYPVRYRTPVKIELVREDEDRTYTPEEASQIAEKLRNLGYLE
jgi:predicted AlkP superfamily phosphohydrolase/phosphomutase